MFQTQLIHQVVEWERRLEIENEKRKNAQVESYRDFKTDPQPNRKERRFFLKSLFERIFKPASERQPVPCVYTPDQCQETQAG